MLLFKGTADEFRTVEHLFRDTPQATQSTPTAPEGTGLTISQVKTALTRLTLKDQQKSLLTLVYGAGKSGILTSDLCKGMGIVRSALAGVRGGLGLRLKHTPDWPKNHDILVRKWDAGKRENRFWMPPVVGQALVELGVVRAN
jgi:hypothetical protein